MNLPCSWLEYDWQIERQAAVFGVDTGLYKNAPTPSRGVLFYVHCMPSDKKHPEMNERLIKRIDSVVRRKLDQLPFTLAGMVKTADQLQYYYYGPSLEQLDVLESCIGTDKKLIIRCGGQPEPEWQTYFKLLYPDRAKLQTIENGNTIELLKKHGDSIAPARRINLHVFFPTEPLRIAFEEHARLVGFAVGGAEFDDESDLPYGVALHKISSLFKRDIDALTTRAIRTAEKYRGALVYWDCSIAARV